MTQRLRRKAYTPLVRMTALVGVICLLVNGMALFDDSSSSFTFSEVSAETSEELKAQKEALMAEQAELEAQRNDAAESLADYEAEKATIEEQIAIKIEEIELNESMTADLEAQIADKKTEIEAQDTAISEKEAAIETKQEEIETEYESLRIRLRELSQTNSLASTMQLLISGNEFTDYLIMTKMSELVSENTQELMDEMEAELQALADEKEALEQTREDLEAEKEAFELECQPYYEAKAELEASKQELDLLFSELTNVTDQLHQDIDTYNADIAAAEAETAEIEELIQEALAAEKADITPSYGGGGAMGWPASQCNYISSTFKFRWGRWHNGLDICGSGCYGSPINAAADGTVIYADWMGGYGQCVMIDHGTNANGDQIVTLYAHASALHVSYGQYVEKGHHISSIGTTGNVTGPHLHFEVRVNGSPVDPIGNGYISTSGVIINESL